MVKGYLRVAGVIFLAAGIVGFFYPFPTLFQLTVLHDFLHIATGIVFLAVSGSVVKSRLTAKVAGYFYLALALFGVFFAHIGSLIMLMPGDNVLHLVIAAFSLFFGYKSQTASQSTDQSV